jgi:Tfp pilus assembly protein FimV
MSNRSVKFAAALVASLLAGANFTAVAENAAKTAGTKTADSCLSGPKGTAPAGSHWYYHLDRATKKQCWYVGEAKNKAAKTATTQQQTAPAPDASAADAAQTQPQPAMLKSVADAHAEVTSPPATGAAAATEVTDTGNPAPDASAAAAPAEATTPSSPVTARWFDASSMGGANGTRLAATASPPAAILADATPQATAAAPPAPATVEAPAEKTSSSTQMLLIVMVGALALAGLVSALVVRLTRTRSSSYEIRDEWRAPWDSINSERAPPISPRRERPIRLSDVPPRRAEPQIPRREPMRNPEQTEDRDRQIAEMLQRLARTTTN